MHPGSLDPSFNPPLGYLMSADTEEFRDRGVEVAVQEDGKIVVLGYGNNNRNEDLVITL
ncbi:MULTISPECIES: hypothetical protein [unclassified Methanoregula]|uniref:hypothetical protein n=1 Tax=unclassified Methanoregula TaxID=2649730 RepID=UPI0009C8B057|nr:MULTISPECIES: hypothetical protein [unclassified Methanoregula]OPX65291.1 MAG: hypothetical protein A4E33_00324 [Methanoregula sp. PtaB.Bin085]OPY32200.1 MAG: hypothetical protein A4E34_02574 [Methanoregula sp. PtaU1.Bin006]